MLANAADKVFYFLLRGKEYLSMSQRRLSVLGFPFALITFSAPPVWANDLSSASATADCNGYSLTVNATDLTPGTAYTINYTFTLSCGATGSGSINFTADGSTKTVTASGSWTPHPLTTSCTVSGSATLTNSSSKVDITFNGQNSTSTTLSCPCTGEIGDFVWRDTNGNGIQDTGEPGINGVTVQLTNGQNILQTALTGSAPVGYPNSPPGSGGPGYYQFTGLCAGSYQVVVPLQPALNGLSPTVSTQGNNTATDSNGSPAPVTLDTNSSVDETIDFGYVSMPSSCAVQSPNSSNFNGTPINGGSIIWFNANFTASGIPSSGATIFFESSTIQFTADQPYNVAVPGAEIVFSPSATCASTSFNQGIWVTTVPVSGNDEIFLSGLAFPVPASFANVNGKVTGPVIWQGSFGSTAPGVSINWKWGAAVYTTFSTDYNQLLVKPTHNNGCFSIFNNGDHAGTPEGAAPSGISFKSFVVGGARGGGGSNWTGSWSGTNGVKLVCSVGQPMARLGSLLEIR